MGPRPFDPKKGSADTSVTSFQGGGVNGGGDAASAEIIAAVPRCCAVCLSAFLNENHEWTRSGLDGWINSGGGPTRRNNYEIVGRGGTGCLRARSLV